MSQDPYENEAQNRWGHTDAYRQSRERMKHYTDEDIEMAKKQAGAAIDLVLEAMSAGLSPDSSLAAEGAEAHRQAISDWWYECSYDMQAHLAQMYLDDSRFRQTYEDIRPGLTQYLYDAIMANAINRA